MYLNNKYVEFYITNICNLTCSECRSFNNFDFKGHYDFDEKLYRQWSQKIQFNAYVILGGEPLLHPQFESWVVGTRKLWPNAWAKVDTNGTQITKVKNLHKLLRDNEYFLCINVHNTNKVKDLMQDILTAFGDCNIIDADDPRIRYQKFQSESGHDIQGGTWLISKIGLPIHIRPAWKFQKTIAGITPWQNLSHTQTNKTLIFKGDSTQAHDACASSRCHIMLDGKIYKCSTIATLPKFLKQKNIKWPDESIYQYQPVTLDNYSLESYDHLRNEIPQCAFCPMSTVDNVDISTTGLKKNKNKFFPIEPIQ